MTPEALAFKNSVVQTIRDRVLSPRYSVWRHEPGGDILWQRDLMLVGSVLLPETPAPEPTDDEPNPVAPEFHLDFDYVRNLIQSEVSILPREFIANVSVGAYNAILLGFGEGDNRQYGRRFYTVNKDYVSGWGLTAVPFKVERDTPLSPYGPHTIVLPDFKPVTHAMRLQAMGL